MSAVTCLDKPLPIGRVLVSMSRSPLLGQSRKVDAPEGCSLAELAELAEPDAFARRYLVAFVDGVEVPVEAWELTRPKAGVIVNIALRAGDGDFFRTILSIAVIAVAAWVSGGALAGAFGGAFAAGTIGAAIAGGVVAIAGNLLINALVPLETPGSSSARPDPSYTVTGARNQVRLRQPVPMVLGRMRMFPPLWGQPIQETVGNDVFLRIPYCFGPGPMAISDVRIGETPLSSFSDVQFETRLKESDPPHLLYAGDPDQDAVGAALTTSFQSRNTASDVDEIEVVFGFRGGLGRIDDKGRKQSKSVTFVVEYRIAGSADAWANVRPNGVQASAAAAAAGEPDRSRYLVGGLLSAWVAQAAAIGAVPSGPFAVTRSDPGKQFQYRVSFAVPRAAAGYEVRVRRTTADTTDNNAVDQAHWEILGSRKSWVDPFPERKLTSGVLRVRATAQLNNVVDTLNFIAEPEVPVFSSAALADPGSATAASLEAPAVSRNCAHLILNVYRGPQNSRPRPDAKIDWPSFAAFAKFCGDNGLTFNEEVQTPMTRAELARRIAQAGYGRLHKWGGKLAVAIDGPRTGQIPSQVFTPRTISNLRWQKSFPRDVHAVIISFANEDNGYQADEVILYLDGYDASNATKFETLQVPGKTNADEVRIVGRQYINNSLRQTEQFSFDMDAEAISCTPGAYTLLQHDVIGVGLGAQRVKTLIMVGGNVAGFTLDHPIKTPVGPTLGCRWRFMDDDGVEAWFEASDEVAVTRDADDAQTFMFVTPRAAAVAPKADDLVMVGETEQVSIEVLVRDIAPDIGRRASLVVIPYSPERFTPDGSPLPPHDPKVTLPIGARPSTPVLLSVKALARELVVSFHIPPMPRGVVLTGVKAWVRESGSPDDAWTPLPALNVDDRIVSAPAGDVGAEYDIRIVAEGRDAGGLTVYSDPLLVEEIDADAAPAQPIGCVAIFQPRTSAGGAVQIVLVASWTPNEDPDILDCSVEIETAPDVWVEIGRARAAVAGLEIHGLQVGRAYNLGFVNLSRRGAPSLRTTIPTVTAADTLIATGAMGAAAGSALALKLDGYERQLDRIAGSDFPGFTIIGGHGDIDIEANVDTPSDISVSAGYIEHWTLGEIEIEATEFGTAWGELFAPWQGFFGLAWSEEPVADRFGNGAGAGHIFPFAYDEDGTVRAYGLDINAGEAFTPELTDMVLARCDKPRAIGSDILSSADGVTNVDNLIRDTTVVNARLETLEATSGEGSAAIEELSLALASEIATRASQTTTLTTNLGLANAAISTNATAISTEASTRASETATLTANLATATANISTVTSALSTETAARVSDVSTLTANVGTLSSSVTTNASAITALDGRMSAYWGIKVAAGTNIATIEAMASGGGVPSTVLINAGQIQMNGAVLINGTVTAAKLSVSSLDAITAIIGLLRTATTGARMELESNQQRIYDSSGNLRVRIGVW